MQRPPSIIVFTILFGLSAVVSSILAFYGAQASDLGFKLPPEAARTLAARIMAIRLAGVAFAVGLMFMVVLWGSRGARSALGIRWVLGLITSVAFLRGAGAIVPLGDQGMAAVVISIVQLIVEGLAILILYGEDARPWFERRRSYSL